MATGQQDGESCSWEGFYNNNNNVDININTGNLYLLTDELRK